MNYKQTIGYIYQLQRFSNYKPGLDRVKYILSKLGNPQKKYKIIHVGGTNGKGSTVTMISSILQSSSSKVGTFTSPHISSFTERIKINSVNIEEYDLVKIFNRIKPIIDKMTNLDPQMRPTFFEITTAIALKYFAIKNVDFAVLEVGLGGRLDSTNIVNPLVSVITNIALEHTDVLGNTKEKIAIEKAGIIKNGPVITAVEEDNIFKIFKTVCKIRKVNLWRVGKDVKFHDIRTNNSGQIFNLKIGSKTFNDLYIPLFGEYQITNTATAVGAIILLKKYGINIKEKNIRNGLEMVKWPGRFEIIRRKPRIILDCAKDPLAMKKLKQSIRKLKYKKLILILSISKDKRIELMLQEIVPIADMVILTKHSVIGRAINPIELQNKIIQYNKQTLIKLNIKDAIKAAQKKARSNDIICIAGSVFIVGEARTILNNEEKPVFGRELNESAYVNSKQN